MYGKELSDEIYTLFNDKKDFIPNKYIKLFNVNLEDLLQRLENFQVVDGEFKDEQVWTFIMAVGYATAGLNGIKHLIKQLTNLDVDDEYCIYLEGSPFPPRKNEGNSVIDLAIGNIKSYKKSGMKLGNKSENFICFCEMKWDADISKKVKGDINRNQLIRIIDNAINYQKYENNIYKYASQVYVNIITPNLFLNNYKNNYLSRLYQYKFKEYSSNIQNVVCELENHNQLLPRRNEDNWKYSLGNLDNLTINCLTYDDLFLNLPNSTIKDKILAFWNQHKKMSSGISVLPNSNDLDYEYRKNTKEFKKIYKFCNDSADFLSWFTDINFSRGFSIVNIF